VSLPPSARKQILEHAASTISHARHRNTQARKAHRKKTIRNLHRRKLTLTEMRTCLGSNFAL
jgi:hypothetical protein